MNFLKTSIIASIFALGVIACSSAPGSENLQEQLNLISLPPGFEIHLYAEGVENARQLALGDQGTVFVGSRKAGKVHAVVDTKREHYAERVYLLAQDLNMPSGIEFKFGSLYVGAGGGEPYFAL